jgi:hypothetical protein
LGEVNHPLVKAVAGLAVLLFLALNFPAVFLAIMAGVLFYAISYQVRLNSLAHHAAFGHQW